MWEAPPMPSALSGIWKKTARLSSSMPSGKSSIEKAEETGIILAYQPRETQWMAEL